VAVSGTLKATVMDGEAIRRSLTRIAHEIVERNRGVDGLVLVGIMNKGVPLAGRVAATLRALETHAVPFGQLDPSRHRDDLHLSAPPVKAGKSRIPPIDGKTVVLVDDVIWHGRTVRAAIDALLEHGRPRSIQLAVLVDRGHRELPIRPDYVGKNVPTAGSERVQVLLTELDGVDRVVILQGPGL
jgi:pyrimidine operon attenuation protein / uracil phosphoribosyltransferase